MSRDSLLHFFTSCALSRGGVGGPDPSSPKVSVVCIFCHHPQFPHVPIHKIAPSPFGSASWSPSGDRHVHFHGVTRLCRNIRVEIALQPSKKERATTCFQSERLWLKSVQSKRMGISWLLFSFLEAMAKIVSVRKSGRHLKLLIYSPKSNG